MIALAYYILVILDVISTILGVGKFGIDAEASYFVRMLMDNFGAWYFIPVLALAVIIALGLRKMYHGGGFTKWIVVSFLFVFAGIVAKNFWLLL